MYKPLISIDIEGWNHYTCQDIIELAKTKYLILHLNLTRNVDQNQDPSMTIIKIFIRLELRR